MPGDKGVSIFPEEGFPLPASAQEVETLPHGIKLKHISSKIWLTKLLVQPRYSPAYCTILPADIIGLFPPRSFSPPDGHCRQFPKPAPTDRHKQAAAADGRPATRLSCPAMSTVANWGLGLLKFPHLTGLILNIPLTHRLLCESYRGFQFCYINLMNHRLYKPSPIWEANVTLIQDLDISAII